MLVLLAVLVVCFVLVVLVVRDRPGRIRRRWAASTRATNAYYAAGVWPDSGRGWSSDSGGGGFDGGGGGDGGGGC